MTDELAKFHVNAPRSTWIGELENSWKYLFHRSFSWVVFGAAIWAWMLTRRHRIGGTGWVERVVLGIVLAQMVLGVVMSQVHIYSWVQVLHVGLAAVLLTFVWLWRFGLSRACEIGIPAGVLRGAMAVKNRQDACVTGDRVFFPRSNPRPSGQATGGWFPVVKSPRGLRWRMPGGRRRNDVEPVAFAWFWRFSPGEHDELDERREALRDFSSGEARPIGRRP